VQILPHSKKASAEEGLPDQSGSFLLGQTIGEAKLRISCGAQRCLLNALVGLRIKFDSRYLSYWNGFSDDLHFMTSASSQDQRNVT
jgi:hypothetical protein